VFLASCSTFFSSPITSNLDTTPTNDLPNPYKTVAPWGHLPADHGQWGALNGVAVDNDGVSLWVVDRCGANPEAPSNDQAYQFDSCAGSGWAPVHKLDAQGNMVKSFGAGMFVFPHKIYQDRDGNVWVVDMRSMNPREQKKFPNAKPAGHTVVKFDQDGKVLMTIGTPGVAGDPPNALNEPCSIAIAENGDLFISEGHSGQSADAPKGTVGRISIFDKTGKFMRSFGKLGSGPGEFKTPHDIALDESERIYVADRGNFRIQILDRHGHYLGEWKQFGRPSGVVLRGGRVYVADSESNGVAPNPGWKRGIRVGDASGKVLYRIPDPLEMKSTSFAEGIAVDAQGNVYGGEVGPRQLAKHLREP
jgi:DNA-binding beta-propeller fold protein YncE